jgi:UDP-N-acetylglucosamine transferase subunit ALG13
MDKIAGLIKEKVVIQRGFTRYTPRNAEYFEFADNLEPFFSKARIVVSHSATSLIEFVLNEKKPIITVPRRADFGEHINDHQVEFARYLEHKTGIKAIINIKDLTPELLMHYDTKAKVDSQGKKKLQHFLKNLLSLYDKR